MASEYASYESEPDGRGTWSIFSSCAITLVLCVYTAVHLHVPAASETRAQKWQYMTGWILLGIFAPELVAWTAWCQWSEARKLTRKMQDMKKSLHDPEKFPSKDDYDLSTIASLLNSWTLKHSYFVIMGGFQFRPAHAVQCPDSDRQWYHSIMPYRYLPQSVLTAAGFLALLKEGHGDKFPILSEGDIDDKSKADGLAKVLACLQGSWILVQIIGRVASHLAVTELEINTLAHVICTVGMYVFWWNKPLKIEQPIFLTTDNIESWLWIRSGLQSHHRHWIRKHKTRHSYVSSHSLHVHEKNQDHRVCDKCDPNWKTGLFLRRDVLMSADEVVQLLKRAPQTWICDFVAPIGDGDADLSGDGSDISDDYSRSMYWLRVNQYELEFLLKLQADFPEYWTQYSKLFPDPDSKWHLDKYSPMIKDEYTNDFASLGATVLLSSLYGAIHATLWYHHFPTVVEMWMWRVSCLVVSGIGLILALIMGWLKHSDTHTLCADPVPRTGICKFVHHAKESVKDWLDTIVDDLGLFISIATVIGALVAVAFCRFFLFIEAFISLRSQPWSVYQTPNWTQWLPHL